MKKGRIIGEVWATRGSPRLGGVKLLLVAIFKNGQSGDVFSGQVIVARDELDAGAGQVVLIAFGSGARRATSVVPNLDVLADAAVVQIVDDLLRDN